MKFRGYPVIPLPTIPLKRVTTTGWSSYGKRVLPEGPPEMGDSRSGCRVSLQSDRRRSRATGARDVSRWLHEPHHHDGGIGDPLVDHDEEVRVSAILDGLAAVVAVGRLLRRGGEGGGRVRGPAVDVLHRVLRGTAHRARDPPREPRGRGRNEYSPVFLAVNRGCG